MTFATVPRRLAAPVAAALLLLAVSRREAQAQVVSGTDADGDQWTTDMDPPDCNDADATVHPTAIEIPRDGVDQDCSGRDAMASYVLRSDAAGGDCTLVGTWDASSATCTLTQDVLLPDESEHAFIFETGGVALDGAGHRIAAAAKHGAAPASAIFGWTSPFLANVTIRALSIEGFGTGIFIHQLVDATIEAIRVSGAYGAAIVLRNGSANVRIAGSEFVSNPGQAVHLENVSRVLLEDNTVADGATAFVIYDASADVTVARNRASRVQSYLLLWADRTDVHDNTFEDVLGREGGLSVFGVDNRFYRNDFVGNFIGTTLYTGTPMPYVYPESVGTLFSLPAPIGGNYWSDPDAGCVDAGGDGFCDAPLVLSSGAQDALPWAVRSGWKDVDGDGANRATDCDDADPSRYPHAPEVKADGIDQDCNGYDLTIEVLKATYHAQNDALRVEATSALGAAAALQVGGYGPMTYDPVALKWTLAAKPAGGDPGPVTVSGIEGATTAALRAQ